MPTPAQPHAGSSDLLELARPIWRRKWLILAIVVFSTVGTYVLSNRQPERFKSSTRIFISSSTIDGVLAGTGTGGDDRTTLDQSTLLLSRPVVSAVIKDLGLRESPDAMLQTVTAEPVYGSNFITITAERLSGAQAADVANSFAKEYFSFRYTQVTDQAEAAISELRKQLSAVPATTINQTQRTELQNTIRSLQTTQATTPRQPQQTNPAIAGPPFAPTPKRDALFALIISAVLSLALAFLLQRVDRRLRTLDDLTTTYDVPLLAVIPHTSGAVVSNNGKASVPPTLREPFRSLRTNIQFAALDTPIKTLVVTSAIAGEGKSTIVQNLALTYREWGLSVVIIDADLRRPSLSRSFGFEQGANGLTSVLTGRCSLGDALLEVSVDTGNLDYVDTVGVAGEGERRGGAVSQLSPRRLALLPSGGAPPNPQAMLASERARRVIEHLGARFDMVIIDTPPLLAVTDALALIPRADGIILVARMGTTERRMATRAVATARMDPSVKVLGIVANDLEEESSSGYGYGYGYGPAYGSASNDQKA